MIIEKIDLNQFRNYDSMTLRPHEGVNIFFGPNGSGKTNLLEAVHYCSLGRSHRLTQDINAVRIGEKGGSCCMTVSGKYGRNRIEVRLRPGESSVKSVWIDEKKVSRLSEMMGVLRCVMFSPEDLDLIKEGPAVRRRYLDMMISQMDRSYFVALQRYRAALDQRNAILRNARISFTEPDEMIQDFEQAMAEYAGEICEKRIRYTKILSELGKQLYRDISGRSQECFSVQYHPCFKWDGENRDAYLKALRESRSEDLRLGSTSAGPHRDDLLLSLNNKNMKLYASQGQMRTAALSLKLAQLNIFRQVTGDQPVLLLDDVMSELDVKRRTNLLELIEGVQAFITCSDEGDLADYKNRRTYQVNSVDGRAVMTEMKSGPECFSGPMKEPVFE